MTYPVKTVKELRGKLKLKQRELLQLNISDKDLKRLKEEIAWLEQCIKYKEQEVNK